jgi:ABC-2 type transport system permease protein
MGALGKLTAMELRLFFREPITVVFTLALPLMILYLLGGVFGNTAGDNTGPDGIVPYRGFGATNWYTAAYVAVAVAGFTLISAPTHMVEYRETGVLRRLRASAVPRWMVLASQFLTSLVIATLGAAVLLVVALAATDVDPPVNWWAFLAAYVLGAFALVSLGLALGAVMPTARAAQSAGLVLWFMLLLICGAGPPPEVLPDAMRTLGQWLPLAPVISLLQEPWLTGGWAGRQALVVVGISVASLAVAWRLFRWE